MASPLVFAQAGDVIWYEDFNNLPDAVNLHAGEAGWASSGDNQLFGVYNYRYSANNVDTQVQWRSESINIKHYQNVGISIDLHSAGALESNEDYINVYYILDGGSKTLLNNGSQVGSFSATTATVSGLSGETLEIIIEIFNDNSEEFIYFDNVVVTANQGSLPNNLIYNETYNGLGYQTNTSNQWSLDVSNTTIGDVGYFDVRQDRLLARDVKGKVIWKSNPVDISGYSSVDISADLFGYGAMESDIDYAKFYYSLNGGSKVLVGEIWGSTPHFETFSTTISGNTVELIVETKNTASDERHVIDNIFLSSDTPLVTSNTIWYEDFNNLPNGLNLHAGQAGWESTNEDGVFSVQNLKYRANNVNGNVEWKSEAINIKYYENVGITIDLQSAGSLEDNEDYIRAYYKIDGGSKTILTNGNQIGSFSAITASASGLSGETLEIIIEIYNDNSDEIYDFDNVFVTADQGELPNNLVYSETFNGISDQTTNSSLWSLDISNVTIGTNGYFEIRQDRLLARYVNGNAVWKSNTIDISSYPSVDISADLFGYGAMESDEDYAKFYYSLNGASKVLVGEIWGDTPYFETFSKNLSGNTLQLIVETKNTSENERFIIDNMFVTAAAETALQITSITGGSISCSNPTVTLNVDANYTDVNYEWSGPNFTSTDKSPQVHAIGTYQIIVTRGSETTTSTVEVASSTETSETLWLEDFSNLSNGTTSDTGSTAWSLQNGGNGTFSVQENEFLFSFDDTNNGTWVSEEIDIASVSDVIFSINLKSEESTGDGFEDSDYIQVYYKLDNGSEILMYEDLAGLGSTTSGVASITVTSDPLTANTIQIIVKAKNSSSDEKYSFDNVTVTGTVQESIDVTASVNEELSCSNSSVDITGGPTLTGGTYSWSGPNNFQADTQNVTVSDSGTYTLTITNDSGCTGTAQVVVNSVINGASVLWLEDFNDLTDGSTNDTGTTAWATDDSSINGGYLEVREKRYVAHVSDENTDSGEGVWSSEAIDISSASDVVISLDLAGEGTLNAGEDYIRVYYRLDGGSEILFAERDQDDAFSNSTHSSPSISGGTVEIVIRTKSTGDTEFYYVDNITVAGNGVGSIIATASVDGELSCGNPSVNIMGAPTLSDATYNWSGPNSFQADTQNVTVSDPGTYTLTITSNAGCTGTTEVVINSAANGTGILWLEDFSGLSNGTTNDSGSTSWSLQGGGSGTFSVQESEFKISFDDTNVGIWLSEVIDISTASDITISVDLRSATSTSSDTFEDSDYLRVYYKLNNGAETLIFEDFSGLGSTTNSEASVTVTSDGLTGNTLQVIVKAQNSDKTELYYLDNIKVTGSASEGIEATASMDGELSCGTSSINIFGGPTLETATYSWSGPNDFQASTQNVTASIPGAYTLTVSSDAGCTGTAVAIVSENTKSPDISASAEGTLSCYSNSTVSLSGLSNTPNVSFSWSDENGIISNSSDAVANAVGTYTLTVIDPINECSSSESVVVTYGSGDSETIWLESFDDLADGVTDDDGATAWSLDDSGISTGYMRVENQRFVSHGSGIDSEDGLGIWSSEVIDITNSSDIVLSVDISGEGSLDAGQDYIRVYYKLNEGPETLFIEGDKDGQFASSTVSSGTLNGTSVQIVIRTKSTGDSEFYYYDNITVTGIGQGSIEATAVIEGDPLLTCINTSVLINGSSSDPDATYYWRGPNNFESTEKDISATEPGLYTLTVSNTGSCSGTASITIDEDTNVPDITAEAIGLINCLDGGVTLSASSTSDNVSFSWTDENGDIIATEAITVVSEPGNYTATVTSELNG
ncbi:hypothetical protein, partial [Reichenbachiella agariperforans]|uniref:hypothetical protein n=1 Tax=Reichenbachiella agariperforans TaxID=156994 RepID=UPI00111498AF